MQKNIVIFTCIYLPDYGGVERYTYNLSKHLQKNGYNVVIVTSNRYSLPEYEKIDGIEIYRLPCWKLLNGRFPVCYPSLSAIKILRKISEYTYDLCIINTRFYPHSLLGALFGKLKARKTILVEHASGHLTIHRPFFDFAGHVYEHILTHLFKLLNIDHFGVSHECNTWLKHFNITAKGVLPNAIDLENFYDTYNTRDNKTINPIHGLPLTPKGINITYAGRIIREKGIFKLLEAFAKIKTPNHIYLNIAGDGPDSNLLEQEIKNRHNVRMFGPLSHSTIITLLKMTDIFALPSDYAEGFPTSVLEAAACRCFIIASRAGGSKELIVNSDHGIILQHNSTAELLNALEFVVNNTPNYLSSVTETTYQRLLNNYTWDITVKKYMALCE